MTKPSKPAKRILDSNEQKRVKDWLKGKGHHVVQVDGRDWSDSDKARVNLIELHGLRMSNPEWTVEEVMIGER
jgi:hypothetical protein